jgi:hypothetical protein
MGLGRHERGVEAAATAWTGGGAGRVGSGERGISGGGAEGRGGVVFFLCVCVEKEGRCKDEVDWCGFFRGHAAGGPLVAWPNSPQH